MCTSLGNCLDILQLLLTYCLYNNIIDKDRLDMVEYKFKTITILQMRGRYKSLLLISDIPKPLFMRE